MSDYTWQWTTNKTEYGHWCCTSGILHEQHNYHKADNCYYGNVGKGNAAYKQVNLLGEFTGHVLCERCASVNGIDLPGDTKPVSYDIETTKEGMEEDVVEAKHIQVTETEEGTYIIEGAKCSGYNWKWYDSYMGMGTCLGYASVVGCGNKIEQGNPVLQLRHITKDLSSGYKFCEDCAAKLGIMRDGMAKGAPKLCLGCSVIICNVCDVCHTEGCSYRDYRVITATAKAKYAHLRAKTQKARGYVTLEAAKLTLPKPYIIICDDGDIEGAAALMKSRGKARTFVRPCPTRPRHGFVDSREIESNAATAADLKALLDEARSKDEEGHAELLIVPYIDSAYNSIVTPTRIAIGPGHDGATAGHGSDTIPLVGVPFPEITEDILRKAGIRDEEDPYIETVLTDECELYFTQIRAGIKIPPTVGKDYVPFPIRVERVLVASGDLIEWEAQAKTITRGTVVCHVGGTLISHYGIHCMNNDIPVFTTREPVVGEALDICSRAPKPDPHAVLKGIAAGISVPMNVVTTEVMVGKDISVKRALIGMMVALHNYAAMGGEDGYNLGLAVATMYRCGMAASHGEARHKVTGYKNSRNTVYKMAFKDFFDARNTLGQAQYKFKNMSWTSGYGGKAWAACTDSIIQMDNSIRKLIAEPNADNVKELVDRLNLAVNQAHNGGWWLNKFIEQQWFDKASKQRLETVVMGATALYHMKNLAKGLDTDAVLEKMREAGEIEVKTGLLQMEVAMGYTKESKPKPKKKVAAKSSGELKSIIDLDNKLAESPLNENTIIQIPFNKDHEDPEYVGVMCSECGRQFKSLSKDAADGTFCGYVGCKAKTGWYEAGSMYIFSKLPAITDDKPVEAEDEDDTEPELNQNGEPFCYDPNCEECYPKGDIFEEKPKPKSKPVGISKESNVGGIVPVTKDSQVVAAQFDIRKGGTYLHVQLRTADSAGYYSFNVNCMGSPVKYVKFSDLMVNDSWSGSEVSDYITCEVKQVEGSKWMLSALHVGILVDITTFQASV